MSTNGHAYGEQLPVPRQREPAFGHQVPVREETKAETRGPLDRRAEALLGLAIAIPVAVTYVVIGYGLYALGSSLL